MKTEQKTYTREFKLEAVRLSLEAGRAGTDVARELGIHTNMLYRWRKEYLADTVDSFPGQGKMKAGDEEVARLRQQVAAVTEPVIVLGDFNMSDQSRAYLALTTSLQDSFREAGIGMGRTFPNNLRLGRVRIAGPLVRIDYVFHSPHLRATSATVNCIDGQSDHCALVVVLSVITEQQESVRE